MHPLSVQTSRPLERAAGNRTPEEVRRRSLIWLKGVTSFGVVGVGILAAAKAGFGIDCLFLHVTGWQCPLCGTTRLATALLRGDVSGAWGLNQFTFVGGVLLLLATILAVAGVLAPQRFTRGLPRVQQDRLYLIVGLCAAIFTVVRNLV